MVQTTAHLFALSLVWLLLSTRNAAALVATCYFQTGKAVDGMFVCNPSAPVSHCCGTPDYCLSNGLCLNAGADNAFTVQGCTSPGWEQPCRKICDNGSGGYRYLTQCDQKTFCCGSDYTCCNDSSKLIKSIPLFTTLARGDGATCTATTGSSASPTASSSTKSSPTQPSLTRPGASSAPAMPTDDTSGKSVAIGAGVGASLGLALLASLALLAWQMRKQRAFKQAAGCGDTPPSNASQPVLYRSVPGSKDPVISEMGHGSFVPELSTG